MEQTIDRVSGISPHDFHQQYVLPLRPVVLVDMCKDWPAMRWDADFFRRHYGQLPVVVEGAPTTLGALLDEFESGAPGRKGRYLRLLKFEDRLPELLPDIQPLPGRGPDRLRCPLIQHNRWLRNGSPELLIAGGGANFPVLHYDSESINSFITQIRGDKQFFLYGPEQTPLMYPKPGNRHESQIDGFDPVDEQRFPLFKQARPISLVVHPGETLFVPARHWHITRVPALSIAVTFNSVSRSNWADFAYDRAYWRLGEPDRRSLGNALKHLWLRGVGRYLDVVEAFGGRA